MQSSLAVILVNNLGKDVVGVLVDQVDKLYQPQFSALAREGEPSISVTSRDGTIDVGILEGEIKNGTLDELLTLLAEKPIISIYIEYNLGKQYRNRRQIMDGFETLNEPFVLDYDHWKQKSLKKLSAKFGRQFLSIGITEEITKEYVEIFVTLQ